MGVKKYIVTAELNIRKFAAKVSDDNLAGTLLPGFILDAVDEVNGDLYLDSSIWLKDANGFFYWKGGVAEYAGPIAPFVAIQQDYNQLLEDISEEARAKKGEGIVIAIIDTGCMAHPDFEDRILHFYDAVNKYESSIYKDDTGHGTFLAGLIASSGRASQTTGLASKAKLIIVKASDEGSFFPSNLFNAMEWLVNKCPTQPHLINMSFNCEEGSYAVATASLFEKAANKGIILIAAAQNNEALFMNKKAIFYPAREKNVIAVGAIYEKLEIDSKLAPEVKYVLPKAGYYDSNLIIKGARQQRGASLSAAITTGAFALLRSYLGTFVSADEIIKNFNATLSAYEKQTINESIKIFKNENFSI